MDNHEENLQEAQPDGDTYTGTPKEILGGAPARGRASGESHGRDRGSQGPPTGVLDQSDPVE
ncbi:MAG: hypothetical protein ACT4OS_04195 [Acidimicrobiales bacterium]